MRDFYLGRPAEEAASLLQKEGYTVEIIVNEAKNPDEKADDMRVTAVRVCDRHVKLVASRFITDISEKI